MVMLWTTERTARMVELIDGGLTRSRAAAQLSEELGEEVTKNMVIGRLMRRHLQPTPRLWPEDEIEELLRLRDVGDTVEQAAARLGRTRWAVKSMLDRLRTVTTARRLARTRFPDYGRCVWPLWGNERPTFQFCGASVAHLGAPYCRAHWRRSGGVVVRPCSV